jgi:hypothetical protein
MKIFPFGVTIPASVPQRSDISEGLMNYPAYRRTHARTMDSADAGTADDDFETKKFGRFSREGSIV